MVERFVAQGGTISIENGSSTVLGTDTNFAAHDYEGAQIWAQPDAGTPAAPPIRIGTVAAVVPRGVYENLSLPLVHPYFGDTLVNVNYELIDGPAIANSATQAAIYARYAAFLEQNMGLVGHADDLDTIDMSLVPNNSLFFDPVTRAFYQWRNGVLEDMTPETLDGLVTLIYSDEVAGSETNTSTAETTKYTYNIAANDYDYLEIEAIVELRAEIDSQTKVVFTTKFKVGGVQVGNSMIDRIIADPTAGTDSGGRQTKTLSVITPGGQGTTTAITLTMQMDTSNANAGVKVMAFRVWGIKNNVAAQFVGPAGNPGGIAYTFTTSTANSDPGAGHVKFDNATLMSATVMRISETDADGNAIAALLATIDDSTSTIKARLRLVDPDTPTKFFEFDVTGTLTDNGTWDTFSITPRAAGTMFANDDALRLSVVAKGDKGDTGAQGYFAGVPYAFSTTTADADPGAGTFRFNNATPASITFVYIDDVDSDAVNQETLIQALDDANGGARRGTLFFIDRDEPNKWIMLNVAGAVVDGTGYWKVPVTYLAVGTLPSNASACVIAFIPAGPGAQELIPVEDVSTTTYTIQTADNGKVKRFTHASGCTITLPKAGAVGDNCMCLQDGGQLTFVDESPNTLMRNPYGQSKSYNAAGSKIGCIVTENSGGSAAQWDIGGDMGY